MAENSTGRQDMRRLAALLAEAAEITGRLAGGGETAIPLTAGGAGRTGSGAGPAGAPFALVPAAGPAGAVGVVGAGVLAGAGTAGQAGGTVVTTQGPALVITPGAFYNLAKGERAEITEGGPILIVPENARSECAPDLVAHIAAPFSSASKALILRSISRPGYRTSTEIMEESGLSAGQFYHHLKEVLKAGLAVKRGRDEYRLSEGGRRAVTVVASLCALLRGQRGLDFSHDAGGGTVPPPQ